MKQKYRFILFLTALLVIGNFSCDQQEKKETTETSNTTSEPVDQPQKKTADKTMLVGEWTRTDAPYQIKITELSDDGKMKTGYFNPRSINVASAMWAFADGVYKIYIELRDENYPGSNYNLIYNPDKDQFEGKYFQAVEGVTYDVAFLRAK